MDSGVSEGSGQRAVADFRRLGRRLRKGDFDRIRAVGCMAAPLSSIVRCPGKLIHDFAVPTENHRGAVSGRACGLKQDGVFG